jgi:hypothetical protein
MSKTLVRGRRSPKKTSIKRVFLHWHNERGQIVVTPKDNDRFMVSIRRAVEVLQKSSAFEQFNVQFRLLLKLLATWLEKRKDVKSAHLTLRDGALSFVVVRMSARYDAQFEDELSDLDIEIANDSDLDLINLNVLSLPTVSEEALSGFIDSRLDLEYCADGTRKRSHRLSKRES